MRRLVKFLCFALVFAVVLFLGGGTIPGSGESARAESPPAIEVGASVNSTSCDSSSGTIMITMTGMPGDPGDLGP